MRPKYGYNVTAIRKKCIYISWLCQDHLYILIMSRSYIQDTTMWPTDLLEHLYAGPVADLGFYARVGQVGIFLSVLEK
jgi:hypothetical protein